MILSPKGPRHWDSVSNLWSATVFPQTFCFTDVDSVHSESSWSVQSPRLSSPLNPLREELLKFSQAPLCCWSLWSSSARMFLKTSFITSWGTRSQIRKAEVGAEDKIRSSWDPVFQRLEQDTAQFRAKADFSAAATEHSQVLQPEVWSRHPEKGNALAVWGDEHHWGDWWQWWTELRGMLQEVPCHGPWAPPVLAEQRSDKQPHHAAQA